MNTGMSPVRFGLITQAQQQALGLFNTYPVETYAKALPLDDIVLQMRLGALENAVKLGESNNPNNRKAFFDKVFAAKLSQMANFRSSDGVLSSFVKLAADPAYQFTEPVLQAVKPLIGLRKTELDMDMKDAQRLNLLS